MYIGKNLNNTSSCVISFSGQFSKSEGWSQLQVFPSQSTTPPNVKVGIKTLIHKIHESHHCNLLKKPDIANSNVIVKTPITNALSKSNPP